MCALTTNCHFTIVKLITFRLFIALLQRSPQIAIDSAQLLNCRLSDLHGHRRRSRPVKVRFRRTLKLGQKRDTPTCPAFCVDARTIEDLLPDDFSLGAPSEHIGTGEVARHRRERVSTSKTQVLKPQRPSKRAQAQVDIIQLKIRHISVSQIQKLERPARTAHPRNAVKSRSDNRYICSAELKVSLAMEDGIV